MKLDIVKSVNLLAHQAMHGVKKYSPEILIVAGVASLITGGVLACKATIKAKEVIDEHKKTMETIEECSRCEEMKEKYTEEDKKTDQRNALIQTGVNLAKLYGPSILLATAGTVSIFASHGILRRRSAALSAAYTGISKAFADYKKRVAEKIGEDAEKEIALGIKAKEIEKEILDPETGCSRTEKEEVSEVTAMPSPYAKYFDEYSDYYEKDQGIEYNLSFLRRRQAQANDMLRANGAVLLNDVYDMLGIPRTPTGAVVGWVLHPEKGQGDAYIDFGIYDLSNSRKRAFVNGWEQSILLDFNVQGDIISSKLFSKNYSKGWAR